MGMINISLIKPKNYIHSYAFLELGELIYYSLKDLGLKAQLAWNLIEKDSKNILIGAHLLDQNFISQVPKNSVILNTEQIYSDTTSWNKNIFWWGENFEVWDYSKRNIEKWSELGNNRVKLLNIGYQKELSRLDKFKNKDVDILFYGSMNSRRKEVISKLEGNGLKVKCLFGVYGKERDEWIERSKIVLNHHFYNSQIFEIVRVFYLLTNSIAVIGEVNETTFIDPLFKNGIFSSKYDELVNSCLEVINNDLLRQEIEHKAFSSISQFPQKIFTEKVLS